MTDHAPAAARRPGAAVAALLVIAAATFAVAAVGGLVTSSSVGTWYAALDKPPWTPPGWLFGPVWTVLYALQALAAWLVWRSAAPGRTAALVLYGLQLVLNLGWTVVFFGLRLPGPAVAEILVLLAAVAATAVAFRRCSRTAAWLLAPYLAWVAFAAVLNAAVWQRN